MSGPSLISILHRRFEAASDEISAIDDAQPPKDGNFVSYYQHERAIEDVEREREALREALLFQPPTNDEDIAFLSYHAWSSFDIGRVMPEREAFALARALASMFNYHVSAAHADIESGSEFHRCALMIFDQCQLRAGKVAA